MELKLLALSFPLESCFRKKLMLPPFLKYGSIWANKKALVLATQMRTLLYKADFPHHFLRAFQSELPPADMVAVSSGRLDFCWYIISYSCMHAQILLALKYSGVSWIKPSLYAREPSFSGQELLKQFILLLFLKVHISWSRVDSWDFELFGAQNNLFSVK